MPSLSLSTTSLEDALLTRVDTTEVSDRLKVMRRQEETTYRCYDYLLSNEDLLRHSSKPVDEDCRVKMCEWCYQVVDFCKFRRETVGIGMSYLDRYLSTRKGKKALSNRKEYQLSAMTTLYIAIKLHEPLEMETSLLADLSRGCYTEMEFVAMEEIILDALEWRVSGPTALGFMQLFLALVPDSVHFSVRSAVMDYARYQSELSVAEHFFVDCLPSEIAFASILNAMEGMATNLLPLKAQSKFIRAVERYSGISGDQVECIQGNLSLLLVSLISHDSKILDDYFEDEEEEYSTNAEGTKGGKSYRQSPVSVARKEKRTSVE